MLLERKEVTDEQSYMEGNCLGQYYIIIPHWREWTVEDHENP
jgi:hypothetical protein